MYCTIEAFLDTQMSVSSYLSDVKQNYIDGVTGELFEQGNLEGLDIKEYSRGIKINGSLSKYFFGNNFETLTREQTKDAVQRISDSLHLDVEEANLSRIDFATNIIITEPPQNYYSFFGDSARLNKSIQGSTLYISNKSRAIVFYDKCKEAKRRKMHIPDEFKNKNVLRYEYRLKRIKKKQITLEDLYSKEIYYWLIDEWLHSYQDIRRIPRLRIKKEIKEMKNLKAFEGNGWKLLIQQLGGIESFYCLLDDEVRRGTISKQNKCYYKKKFDKLFNSEDLFEPNTLINELNGKVKEAAERYRC